MKYVQLKPGSTWYYGSAERNPTHVPPCSFFAKHRESAGRWIHQPGVVDALVAVSYTPARLVAAPRLLDVHTQTVRRMFAGVYEHEKAADFCARREEFIGVDGWYNNMPAGGILLFEPDRFMRYGRPVQFSAEKVKRWRDDLKRLDLYR